MAKKKGEEVLETPKGPDHKYIFPYPNSPNGPATVAKRHEQTIPLIYE